MINYLQTITQRKHYCLRYLSKVLLTIFAVFALVINVNAQERTISGKITGNSDGLGIPGVNVMVKGSTIGTVTDIDGKFNINASPTDVVVVSFIGFQTQEIEVGNRSSIDIVLMEDIADLDEVVVIGYGVQKKKLLTGATAQVKGGDLEKRNSTSTLQAMQGQIAGVNITSTSGQPGESMKVTIRGVGTIGDASPLYIVDGIQTSDISYINSADIESIDVLKDAASAAIYGSRAANGVVLITTKKGTAGKSQVTFDAYYGVQNVAKKIDLLNTEQYAMIINEQDLNSGRTEEQVTFDLDNLPAYTNDGVANTNWLDEMFVKNALTKNMVVGLTGGSEQSTYSMSVSYTGQEGIVGGADYSNYERYGGRFNSDYNLFDDHIKVGQNLTLTYIKDNGIAVGNQYSNSLRGAFNTSPLLPMYDDNGEFINTNDEEIRDQNANVYWHPNEVNPYASMVYNNQNANNTQKALGNIYADIKLIRNLKFRTSLGVDYYSKEQRSYKPAYTLSAQSTNERSEATQRMEKGLGLTFDNLLTYSTHIGNHKIDGMAGMSSQQYSGSFLYGKSYNLAFYDLEHAYMDNATDSETATLKEQLQGAPHDEDRLLSYFGRVQYGYNETYLFNATFRADGSSKFAKGNRWGYFPSFSAGWVMSNENFMSPTAVVLNFFKLRASWGQNGNQNIKSYQYVAPIQFSEATYNFGDSEGVNTTGSFPNRLPNEDLKWETSEQLNIGFDSRLLNSRLSVNFDYYNKTTKDWLITAPILSTAGADAPVINGGNVTNKGIELALSFTEMKGDFNYTISANGAFNKNEVTEIPTEDGIIHGATNMLYVNGPEFYRAESGHPIGFFWGYETDGLFQTEQDVLDYTDSEGNLIQRRAEPGDVKLVDKNGDGILDNDDKVQLGDPNPDFIYGLSFNCSYKAFDFMIVTNGVAGNQIVQTYRSGDKYSNYTTAVLGRWTGEGTSNTIPRVTNGNTNYSQFTKLYMQDGDYFRISNVTFGYDLTKTINIKNISQLRFYVSAQNLHTFTKYDGMDPEVGYGFDNGESDKFSSGIDLGYYPRPRTFLAGVSVKF